MGKRKIIQIVGGICVALGLGACVFGVFVLPKLMPKTQVPTVYDWKNEVAGEAPGVDTSEDIQVDQQEAGSDGDTKDGQDSISTDTDDTADGNSEAGDRGDEGE